MSLNIEVRIFKVNSKLSFLNLTSLLSRSEDLIVIVNDFKKENYFFLDFSKKYKEGMNLFRSNIERLITVDIVDSKLIQLTLDKKHSCDYYSYDIHYGNYFILMQYCVEFSDIKNIESGHIKYLVHNFRKNKIREG